MAKDGGKLRNSGTADQPYSKEKKWGYVGANTTQRTLDSEDLYERLRYVNDSENRTLTYRFDGLESGDYSVYLGFYDPTGWYKEGQRVAMVTLRQNDKVLKSGETVCGGKGSGQITEYSGLTLANTGDLQITLTPKNTGEGSDMQISWIAIVDHTKRDPNKPTPPDSGGTTQPGPNGPTQPAKKTNIGKAAKVTLSQSSYTYSGSKRKPAATVKVGSKKLKKDRDYTLSYKDNVQVGTASVVITGKGNYTGKITKKFTINPKGTSLSGKIKAQRKGFLVKWKKQAKNTTGYQVQYSTSRKFTKKTTAIKTVKKKTVTKLDVKKLKAKKKYYVRVRTYHTVKGRKYYSGWSKVKNVSTKK